MYICENNTIKLIVRVLIVDFYDSFTYNLKHYIEPLCESVKVVREDQVDLSTLVFFDKIILSPGPGLPFQTKNMFNILNKITGIKPILGVCLGMQGIVEFEKGVLVQKKIKHGKQELIHVNPNSILFNKMEKEQLIGLYHSWSVEFPQKSQLIVTAKSKSDVIMAVESKESALFGVQFHPESILSPNGMIVIKNFLKFEIKN